MNKNFLKNNLFFYFFILLFSFGINFYYANLGVYPIDTFAFFDTAYSILLGLHPFKDIWITTGPVVDYLQAFFFWSFGLSWNSYVLHASLLNSLISVFLFTTLLKFNLNKYLSLFYSVAFSVLAYTVSGTPFAYLHSYTFSLLAILIFFHCIKFKSGISFYFLPIIIFLAFFSMQNPATFISLIILIFLFIYFYYNFEKRLFAILLIGFLSTIMLLFIYLWFSKVPIENIWIQYFLFPLSIAKNRIMGNELAHFTLYERSSFRNIIGHFKFINLYILLFLITTFKEILNKNLSKEEGIINFSLIFLGIALIFNQLLTSNQTYIFSLIPFLGAFFHIFFKRKYPKLFKTQMFLVIIVLFCTLKYHGEYNSKRKFIDLQNVNLSNFAKGSDLDKKFENLKWITPLFPDNPKKEIALLKDASIHIGREKSPKMVITTDQFFSLLLEENLNIPNRWYTRGGNSYPLKGNEYFNFYKAHLNKIIIKKKIKVIFFVRYPAFNHFKDYFEDICFNKTELNEITNSYTLKDCN